MFATLRDNRTGVLIMGTLYIWPLAGSCLFATFDSFDGRTAGDAHITPRIADDLLHGVPVTIGDITFSTLAVN